MRRQGTETPITYEFARTRLRTRVGAIYNEIAHNRQNSFWKFLNNIYKHD
jgi:hypothetical protein